MLIVRYFSIKSCFFLEFSQVTDHEVLQFATSCLLLNGVLVFPIHEEGKSNRFFVHSFYILITLFSTRGVLEPRVLEARAPAAGAGITRVKSEGQAYSQSLT